MASAEAPAAASVDAASVESELCAGLIASGIPSALVSMKGEYLWVNDAACTFFGRDSASLLAARWQDLILPEEIGSDEAQVRDLLEGGVASIRRRKPYMRGDGKIVWGDLTVSCIRDSNGGVRHLIAQIVDVTDLVRTAAALEESRDRLQSIIDADVDPRAVFDPERDDAGAIVDFRISMANPAALAYLGHPDGNVLGHRLSEFIPAEAFTRGLGIYRGVLETGTPFVHDRLSMPRSIGGVDRTYDLRVVRAGTAASVIWRDVTAIVEAERSLTESEARYRLLAENATDVVVQTLNGTMTWLSPALRPALGWRPDEWIGHCLEDFTHPDDVARLQMRRADIGQGQDSLFRIRLRGVDGADHWVELHAGPNLDAGGRNVGMVAAFRVIDAQIEVERQREHLAHFDALTGLMNRAQVIEAVRDVVEQTPRTGSRVALLFCDVDRFKEVNDEHGHAIGDFVLRALGERIRECIRADDFAARIGGDEFLVVLTGLHDASEALAIAEKIRSAADAPITLNPRGRVRTGMSIGVALAKPGEAVDRFIERADTAMYRAKKGGRNLVSS